MRMSIAAQQREAVELWQEIVRLAGEIYFANPETADFVKVSSSYGLGLYRIYQAYINLNLAGLKADPKELGDLLTKYDAAWQDYQELLKDHPNCASLYEAHVPGLVPVTASTKSPLNFIEKLETNRRWPPSNNLLCILILPKSIRVVLLQG